MFKEISTWSLSIIYGNAFINLFIWNWKRDSLSNTPNDMSKQTTNIYEIYLNVISQTPIPIQYSIPALHGQYLVEHSPIGARVLPHQQWLWQAPIFSYPWWIGQFIPARPRISFNTSLSSSHTIFYLSTAPYTRIHTLKQLAQQSQFEI